MKEPMFSFLRSIGVPPESRGGDNTRFGKGKGANIEPDQGGGPEDKKTYHVGSNFRISGSDILHAMKTSYVSYIEGDILPERVHQDQTRPANIIQSKSSGTKDWPKGAFSQSHLVAVSDPVHCPTIGHRSDPDPPGWWRTTPARNPYRRRRFPSSASVFRDSIDRGRVPRPVGANLEYSEEDRRTFLDAGTNPTQWSSVFTGRRVPAKPSTNGPTHEYNRSGITCSPWPK